MNYWIILLLAVFMAGCTETETPATPETEVQQEAAVETEAPEEAETEAPEDNTDEETAASETEQPAAEEPEEDPAAEPAEEQFEGYERLILDVFHGNPTLFPQPAEIDASWAILDPLLEFWDKADAPDPVQYASGTSGPESSDQLMNRDARSWRELKSTFGKSQ